MFVKIKKLHSHAQIPTYAHETDAGLDLTCVESHTDEYGNLVCGESRVTKESIEGKSH